MSQTATTADTTPYIEDLFQSFYFNYAMAVIMDRSVPDVRDGLKPVHRRILYAMHRLKLAPNSPTRKSARVVGDVIGQFHPHGDQAVYDALVRMAQDWSLRYPLVKGQGNFGSLDGDNAAAMRYTECRLTEIGQSLMDARELREGVIDLVPNYDDSTHEPDVLPAKFPMLLCNGTEGIAVGIASSIPPHNMKEVMQACIKLARKLARKDELTDAEIDRAVLGTIQGPDFPTGGMLYATEDEIRRVYRKGEGSFRLRARWEVEDLKRGRWQIVVTEIPYMVAKGALLEAIGSLMEARKAPMIEDVIDESEGDGIRIVIVPKSSTIDPESLMDFLFSETGMESSVRVNCNVIVPDESEPEQGRRAELLSIPNILMQFLKFREQIVVRRSQVRLVEVRDRMHILEGRLLILPDIDKVIAIIRSHDEPENELMRVFDLSREQANDILALRLRQLRKLEEMEMVNEMHRLTEEKNELMQIINERSFRWKHIEGEFKQVLKAFGDERRTEIVHQAVGRKRTSMATIVPHDPVTVAFSKMGWIRAVRSHKDEPLAVKDGDKLACQATGYTNDHAIFINRKGRAFSMLVNDIPTGRGFGAPISKWFSFATGEFPNRMFILNSDAKCLVATSNGNAFVCQASDIITRNKKGKAFLTLKNNSEVHDIVPIRDDHDAAAFISDDGYMLVVRLNDLPVLAKGAGVRAIRMPKGISLRQVATISLDSDIRIGSSKRATTVTASEVRETYSGERAGRGKPLPKTARNGLVQPSTNEIKENEK